MLIYRPKQKTSTTTSEEVKFPASSIDGLATVATSGSYNDLTDKPEVPGVPDIVQTTGTSTTAVMSQNAVTNELNKKANSADLANYVTTDTDQDIKGKKTVVPPSNKDNSNQIATTAWAGRRYKSIADFGFTSQTTVKAIVQKIIDNWYEYCTFACTNDNFNNFSDTPDGYGTLIIDVGSNALRPFISFTKQIGDSNSYKHWQANIVRGENNQISEIQWYEIINSNLPQTISGEKTFVSNIICDSKVVSYSAVESNNEVPNFNGILKDDLYTTTPTKTRGAQYLARDTNGAYIGGLRVYHDTNGTIQAQLMCRSQNTEKQKNVALVASKDSTGAAGDWRFVPNGDAVIDLGASGQRWNNGYITNIKGCKVINDGGDNLTINGTATVATPPNKDNSNQIATTAWVRSHNQAIRGFDGPNYYTVDNVKHYYPDDNYFLVAYTDFCVNWQHVCAEMDVIDLDTRLSVYKLKVSGLLESATSNNTTTYTNKGNIGVTDSFGGRLNTGTTDINNEFFLVCRTTNKGRVRYEIWCNQRYSYNRHKFYFSVDEAHARTGVTQHFTWNKMRVDNAVDVNYAKAGVTAYMESGNINPTYIPTSSWGVDVFKTALSNDESYTNVTIFNNNLYSTTQVGVSTILNTTPYIDAKIQGYNGYKTIPSAQKTAEYRILSEDKGYLGGIRYDRYKDGDSNTRLSTTSTLSGASNGVMLYATKGTASTKSTDSNIWQFSPATDGNINLGGTGNRWLNGYITNLQLCKVINGGGGNSLIQQNSDTAGADITVGSTNCALKMLGKNARPTYRQGKNGTYANLALQSDIPPIPFYSDDLSTGTFGSTTIGRSNKTKAVYFEDRDTSVCGFLYGTIYTSPKLYYLTNVSYESTSSGSQYTFIFTKYTFSSSEKMIKSTHKIALLGSGKTDYSEQTSISGTFYYKVLE